MSHTEFYPYPTKPDSLLLSCGVDHPEATLEDHQLFLQGVPDDDVVKLNMSVSMTHDVAADVLPEDERDKPPTRVLVLARSLTSRIRQRIELESEGNGAWTGKLELTKSELSGTLELEPVLVRTTTGDHARYAKHEGARLGWGEQFRVEIDDSPMSAGGYLESRWEDFASSGSSWRKQNSDRMYLLDTDVDPPMLWLNEGIPHFKAVSHARGARGRDIRVRDAVLAGIVSQVWTSLVSVVITRLAAAMAEDEPDTDQAVETLSDWETRVIYHWAPMLLPEEGSKTDAVRQMALYAAAPDGQLRLQDRLTAHVQTQARDLYAFRGLIKLRDRDGV